METLLKEFKVVSEKFLDDLRQLIKKDDDYRVKNGYITPQIAKSSLVEYDLQSVNRHIGDWLNLIKPKEEEGESTKKKKVKLLDKKVELKNAVLRFDGACSNNGSKTLPTPTGGGWVIVDPTNNKVYGAGTKFVSNNGTCNIGEYNALKYGLDHVLESFDCENLSIEGDSSLVVNQVVGDWGCNQPHLQVLLRDCHDRLKKFTERPKVTYISRNDNTLADSLSKFAVDTKKDKKFTCSEGREGLNHKSILTLFN